MASVPLADLQSRPTACLDFTSLTVDEFQHLVPPFDAAFQAHRAAWRRDGPPRTARRFPVYHNCPLPTPEDRLLFRLAYVKTYALQVVQRRLFGLGQRKANPWIHGLLPVLLAALRPLGAAPACSLTALAQRLVRPQDPPVQTACESGKKQDHTGKKVLRVNALLLILCLSETDAGRVHDTRMAEATPSPLPAGSRL
jgi:hypothetical protein